MTREEFIKYLNAWANIWEEVSIQEGWTKDTNPSEHIYIYIEPYSFGLDMIDSILVFADGTVEFHLVNESDAYYWNEWPIKVIEEMIKRVNP